MKSFEEIKKEIINIIKNSPIPEDPYHAENTLYWLLKIYPQADIALKISAVGHDIERAFSNRVKRENFNNYDEFKKAHAEHSAKILKKILLKFYLADSIINKVYNIVKNHEHGGDFYSDILKDADSLSFFDVNIEFYYKREGFEKTLERAKWGYKRLSKRAKKFFIKIEHKNHDINEILNLLKKGEL